MPKGEYDRTNRLVPIEQRFFKKVSVNEETGCWEWNGSRNSFGHGSLYRGGITERRLLMAHRVSWELHHGEIPEGMCVLHRCDVPYCVNPNHLFLGTKADNSKDMVNKNRQKRDSDLPQTKLTMIQVEAIRKCTKLTQKEIATLCGVTQGTISLIKSGKKRA